jgi:exosortase A-associated hydrolase 2
LLLWQPATQGKAVLQQFLRLEAAAALIAGPATPNQPTARERLKRGEHVHIAGYALGPALASGLEAARLTLPDRPCRVEWLDCSPNETPQASPAVATAVQNLIEAGHSVHLTCVQGPAFWQTTEIEDAPSLLQATRDAVRRSSPVRPKADAMAAGT